MAARKKQWLVIVPAMMFCALQAHAYDDSLSVSSERECALPAGEVVERFLDLLFQQKKVRQAFENWVVPNYIQHKATLPDGREAVIEFLEKLFAKYPERIFTIHRVVASDDLVAVHYHSQATLEDAGFAVIDIFRVENCRLVEHWDVVQPVAAQSMNNNTVF